jgi:hypothetical protein
MCESGSKSADAADNFNGVIDISKSVQNKISQ